MSVFNDLLTQTQALIAGLSFTWGSNDVQVIVASQPLNLETLSPALPVIYVTPSTMPEEVQQGATGGYVDVAYRLDISVVAPGNASFDSNLPAYLSWREQLRQTFQRAYLGSIPGFWGVKVTPKDVINRDLQRDNYDFSVLGIEYLVLEKATA